MGLVRSVGFMLMQGLSLGFRVYVIWGSMFMEFGFRV